MNDDPTKFDAFIAFLREKSPLYRRKPIGARYRPEFLTHWKPKFSHLPGFAQGPGEGWHFYFGPVHVAHTRTYDNPHNWVWLFAWQPRGPNHYRQRSPKHYSLRIG